MKQEDKLIEKFGRKSGMKVPDGYFEDFAKKMETRLPEYPAKPVPQKLTRWQRVRPYVYLAAMFAGIWCMMKVFHTVSQSDTASLDNPPAVVVAMLDNPSGYDYFIDVQDEEGSSEDFVIEEEVASQYTDMAQFEEDFKALDYQI